MIRLFRLLIERGINPIVSPQLTQTSFGSPNRSLPSSPFGFLIYIPALMYRAQSFLNSKLLSSLRFQRPVASKSISTSFFRSPSLTLKPRWVQQDEDSAWPFFTFVLKNVLSSGTSLVEQKTIDQPDSTPSKHPLRLSRRV